MKDKRSLTSIENGKLGGVKTAEGKAISSQNSLKHGIFAKYSTELDDETFEAVFDSYATEFGADSPARKMLISQLSVLHIRLKRCARFESEFITAKLNPPKYEEKVIDEGLKIDDLFERKVEHILVDEGKPMALSPEALVPIENVFLKYEQQFLSRYCHIVEVLTRTQK